MATENASQVTCSRQGRQCIPSTWESQNNALCRWACSWFTERSIRYGEIDGYCRHSVRSTHRCDGDHRNLAPILRRSSAQALCSAWIRRYRRPTAVSDGKPWRWRCAFLRKSFQWEETHVCSPTDNIRSTWLPTTISVNVVSLRRHLPINQSTSV